MSWITVIWSMNAGACLTLAVFYGAVWCKQRENKQAELLAQQQRGELERLTQQKTAFLDREVAKRARLEREAIESCAREQRRIAHDLHDGIGQQLVGIALSAKPA